MDACAICGRPSRYLAAFPTNGARVGVGVVYDGAPVCSRACALTLRQRHYTQAASEASDTSGEPAAPRRCNLCGQPIGEHEALGNAGSCNDCAWGDDGDDGE